MNLTLETLKASINHLRSVEVTIAYHPEAKERAEQFGLNLSKIPFCKVSLVAIFHMPANTLLISGSAWDAFFDFKDGTGWIRDHKPGTNRGSLPSGSN